MTTAPKVRVAFDGKHYFPQVWTFIRWRTLKFLVLNDPAPVMRPYSFGSLDQARRHLCQHFGRLLPTVELVILDAAEAQAVTADELALTSRPKERPAMSSRRDPCDHSIALIVPKDTVGLKRGKIYRGSFMRGLCPNDYGFFVEVTPGAYRYFDRSHFRPVNPSRNHYWERAAA